jgi:hypothetical protein
VQGDIAIRSVLRLHPRTLARFDHDQRVTSVAFSPDGTRVATGSDDGSARVFHAATGAELARLDHDGEVTAVAFSPDGDWVISGSTDKRPGSSRPPGQLVQRALRAMDRPLNPAELRRYSLPPDCRHIRRRNRLGEQYAPRNSAGALMASMRSACPRISGSHAASHIAWSYGRAGSRYARASATATTHCGRLRGSCRALRTPES